MGDGVIDGRGGVKLRGKNVSAWDLAEQARNRLRRVELTLRDLGGPHEFGQVAKRFTPAAPWEHCN